MILDDLLAGFLDDGLYFFARILKERFGVVPLVRLKKFGRVPDFPKKNTEGISLTQGGITISKKKHTRCESITKI